MHKSSSFPASPQEFKCTDCEFRALNQADVELHRRSMHRNINSLAQHQPRLGGGGPYVIANPANLSMSVDTKPGRSTMFFNEQMSLLLVMIILIMYQYYIKWNTNTLVYHKIIKYLFNDI